MHSHFIPVGSGRIYAEQRGRGADLVLLHSSNADSRMWDALWSAFIRRYSVLRFDARGHGRSSPPSRPYAAHEDLHAVLKASGIRRAALVGHSMGGSVALDYTLAHPSNVSALVVCAAGPSGREPASGQLRAAWQAAIAHRRAGETNEALESELRLWVDGPRRPPFPRLARLRRQISLMSNAIAPSTWWVPRISLQPTTAQRLHEIGAPVLPIVSLAMRIILGSLTGRGCWRVESAAAGSPSCRDARICFRWSSRACLRTL